MLKPRQGLAGGPKRKDPNLFLAALNNDLEQLKEALAAGKSLSQVDPRNGFTPLHVAAFNGSLDFIREAAKSPTAEPWLRDHAGLLAIDHADARKDYEASRLFFNIMYPGNRVPITE